LQFTMCKATRAAHKLPSNASEVCLKQFLHLALTMWDNVIISASFHVNIDQTNIIYQPANNYIYEISGSKQVAVVGQEEKCACTLVCGVSNSGELLPFQIILQGKSKHSLPSPKSPGYEEAAKLSCKFVVSNTDTYWSTFETMCSHVSDILVPFWNEKKKCVNAPADQPCILQLNVWVVHCSIAFRMWLDKNYSWIQYQFVPAGTPGI
ncbi:hypothetical protein PAXRUDRAFT_126380, partial [Paxillus rubicundulus Ve08.2h10]